jgi:hypothetical protein
MIAAKVACGAPALVRVTGVPGSSTGYWATPQPQMTAATPGRGDDPDPVEPADGEEGQDGQAARAGGDHEGSARPVSREYRAGFEVCSSAMAARDSAPAMMAAAWARRVK